MRIITKIIAVMAICFVLGTIGLSIYVYNSSLQIEDPILKFSMDENERTLTVEEIKNFNLDWEDISLFTGDAILPSSGTVRVNDVITKCYGTVEFMVDGSTFGGWVFSEKPVDYFEDIRFIGLWKGEGQELNFYPDGTYFNYYQKKDDHGDDDGLLINNGRYKTEKNQLILDEIGEGEPPYLCDVSFSAGDTQLGITCLSVELAYTLERSFTTDLYVTILNVSEKLDDCLSFFISNYSNETHQDVLSQGLNTTVVFTNELTPEKLDNLTTQKNIVFNTGPDGNITLTGLNYSVQIDSLQDLYYLVYRVDVERIIAADSKFNDFGMLCNSSSI